MTRVGQSAQISDACVRALPAAPSVPVSLAHSDGGFQHSRRNVRAIDRIQRAGGLSSGDVAANDRRTARHLSQLALVLDTVKHAFALSTATSHGSFSLSKFARAP